MSNKGSPCHHKEMMEVIQQGHTHSTNMAQQYSQLFEAFAQSVVIFKRHSKHIHFYLPQQIHKQQNQQLLSLTKHVTVVQFLCNTKTPLLH